MDKIKLALKIDIDTFQGAKLGTPKLLNILKKFNIKATFFATLGPDNSGKAIFRVFTKGFVKRMFKLRAAKTYGLKTLFYGTLLPAPVIADRCSGIIKEIKKQGHEIGLHAYDHVKWHNYLQKMSLEEIKNEFSLGVKMYKKIFNKLPKSFASPGWQCNEHSLEVEDSYNLLYSSDTRGKYPFFPKIKKKFKTLQIPTTLPTFDELIIQGVTEEYAPLKMVSLLSNKYFNVLNIHPEFEGATRMGLFRKFLEKLENKDILFLKLGDIATNFKKKKIEIKTNEIFQGKVNGRSGYVSCQKIKRI